MKEYTPFDYTLEMKKAHAFNSAIEDWPTPKNYYMVTTEEYKSFLKLHGINDCVIYSIGITTLDDKTCYDFLTILDDKEKSNAPFLGLKTDRFEKMVMSYKRSYTRFYIVYESDLDDDNIYATAYKILYPYAYNYCSNTCENYFKQGFFNYGITAFADYVVSLALASYACDSVNGYGKIYGMAKILGGKTELFKEINRKYSTILNTIRDDLSNTYKLIKCLDDEIVSDHIKLWKESVHVTHVSKPLLAKYINKID
jgi:hypothetical protein